MADVIYLLLLLATFAGFVLLVQGCDRIVRSGDDTAATDTADEPVGARPGTPSAGVAR